MSRGSERESERKWIHRVGEEREFSAHGEFRSESLSKNVGGIHVSRKRRGG